MKTALPEDIMQILINVTICLRDRHLFLARGTSPGTPEITHTA